MGKRNKQKKLLPLLLITSLAAVYGCDQFKTEDSKISGAQTIVTSTIAQEGLSQGQGKSSREANNYEEFRRLYDYVAKNLSFPGFQRVDVEEAKDESSQSVYAEEMEVRVDPDVTFDKSGIIGKKGKRNQLMVLEYAPLKKDKTKRIEISFHYDDPEQKAVTYDFTTSSFDVTQNTFLLKYGPALIRVTQDYDAKANPDKEKYYLEQQKAAVSKVKRLLNLLNITTQNNN